jgi:hypothetical protein
MEKNFATVIMAAGKGTRMKNSEKAKVMFEVAGKPMIQHVVDLAIALHSTRIIAIVGFCRESVTTYVHRTSPSVEFAVQEPQLGTGHAMSLCCRATFRSFASKRSASLYQSTVKKTPSQPSLLPTLRIRPGTGESFGAKGTMLSVSSSTRTRQTTKEKCGKSIPGYIFLTMVICLMRSVISRRTMLRTNII